MSFVVQARVSLKDCMPHASCVPVHNVHVPGRRMVRRPGTLRLMTHAVDEVSEAADGRRAGTEPASALLHGVRRQSVHCRKRGFKRLLIRNGLAQKVVNGLMHHDGHVDFRV